MEQMKLSENVEDVDQEKGQIIGTDEETPVTGSDSSTTSDNEEVTGESTEGNPVTEDAQENEGEKIPELETTPTDGTDSSEKKELYVSNEERNRNLEAKRQVIEELKLLVTKEEAGGQTFQEFRALQEKWKNIGQVPQANVSELWENYHLQVENFYNYIKINKELRDLDLKHNLEIKTGLCEQAETLSQSDDIANAFKILQSLHVQWKETGPVVKEKKDELWERFRSATTVINEKYHQFFDELRKKQDEILQKKEEICKEAETISDTAFATMKEWQKATEALLDLQKQWKELGEVAPKDRNRIFKKFRVSCDKFFNEKRDFFKNALQEQNENMKLKEQLCERVEALQESEDWREATDAIIKAQKEWKEIGSVPQKYSQKIWKRFRSACDVFFNRKNEHFKSIDSEQAENLAAKKAIIDELDNFTFSEIQEENLNKLKDIQKRWNAIGYVPLKKKDAVQELFRNAVNAVFDKLDIPSEEKELEKFRSKVNSYDDNKDKSAYKIVNEREKLTMQIRQLENDINTFENNMGFLSVSKNAEVLIADLNKKAQQSKEKLALLKDKLKELDKII